MSRAEKRAIRPFIRYLVDETGMSFVHATRWAIGRLRRGLVPLR